MSERERKKNHVSEKKVCDQKQSDHEYKSYAQTTSNDQHQVAADEDMNAWPVA